ncbi:MAG: COX15/CtaA family protein [Rhodospirillaceae bacterium]|jgi:heme a synthase|nr:COX15/CtaA family protein [Rhodospirillaceae bacterium]
MPQHAFNDQNAKHIRLWLLICAGMVFIMVVLGGATRLTESGLSMVEWQPLNILPPLSETAWQQEFEKYQKYPEFQKVNSWMAVEDFKNIFWLEYIHRLWGRLIGLVFAIPFFYFVATRRVQGQFAWTLAGLLALGGAQGLLGWFMVASGLVDRPDVSQYRLAAHLVLAFIVYGLLIWVALGVRPDTEPDKSARHHDTTTVRLALATALAVLLAVTSGAFVAGLNAGLIYNTFPLMDGQMIPDGLYDLSPWYMNWFENIMTVQFNHRALGIVLACLVTLMWWRIKQAGHTGQIKFVADCVFAMAFVQAGLGITTLLMTVPLPLALAHQTGALILFTLSVIIARLLRPA